MCGCVPVAWANVDWELGTGPVSVTERRNACYKNSGRVTNHNTDMARWSLFLSEVQCPDVEIHQSHRFKRCNAILDPN